MKNAEILYLTDRDCWRAWLEEKHKTEKEAWLIYYKKHTDKASISYDDAVEEAICFGWIDGLVKKIDDEKYARKFFPRKGRSKWSELNMERARKMIKTGKMTEAGLAKFNERIQYDEDFLKARKSNPEISPDLKKALKENKRAWENFNKFAPSYRKQYILWVTAAKRDETRQKRIEQVVELSEQNKKPGMM